MNIFVYILCPVRSSEKYKRFHKISFSPYFPYKPLFVVVVKKMETAPKIDPIGIIRRNGLFQKKPFIFNLPYIFKHKNRINKTSLFVSFFPPKMSLSTAKKVKCFLGLKKKLFGYTSFP